VAWDLLDRGWSLVYLPDVVVHHHPSAVRDPGQRAIREARNRVWSSWMRRSVRAATRQTVGEVRTARRTGGLRALASDVARGVPMVLAERRRLTRATEALLRRVGR
jgi:hypothetical protein